MESEVPLTGGNMNAVVRVGDRVHRAAGPQTPTIHRLLSHVRAQGVGWVPRVHGYDDRGREVLDFLPGEVHHVVPDWMREDRVLREVGARLREWHDATATFEQRPENVWWWQPGKQPQEVICHVDFAPYNHVYRERAWVGAIDYDLCYPGPRLWDVAYTAYRYAPLLPHLDDDVDDDQWPDRSDAPLAERQRRLDVMLAGYGELEIDGAVRTYTAAEVLGRLPERLDAMADWCDQQASPDLRRNGRMYRAHARWIESGALLDTLEA